MIKYLHARTTPPLRLIVRPWLGWRSPTEGDASIPSPHPLLPRPYAISDFMSLALRSAPSVAIFISFSQGYGSARHISNKGIRSLLNIVSMLATRKIFRFASLVECNSCSRSFS